jgi:hypothetical protein
MILHLGVFDLMMLAVMGCGVGVLIIMAVTGSLMWWR